MADPRETHARQRPPAHPAAAHPFRGDQRPELRGKLETDRPLAPLTWLRVGGPARWFFGPADAADLAAFLGALSPDVPVLPIGVCSNLIVRDGGWPGVVIRLGRAFSSIEVLEGHRIRAGAAALDSRVALRAAEAGIAGLSFFRTIPGTIGGAVRMNAGCYGSYTADILVSVDIVHSDGRLETLDAAEIGLGYRSSSLPEGAIVLSAVLQGAPGDPLALATAMEVQLARRAVSQPVDQRSCGSTFRNPAGYSSTGATDDPMEMKAWSLIDRAGCRGLRRGGAQISEQHANFLINAGDATAADLEDLGEAVRERVKDRFGIELVWEIARVGVMVHEE